MAMLEQNISKRNFVYLIKNSANFFIIALLLYLYLKPTVKKYEIDDIGVPTILCKRKV